MSTPGLPDPVRKGGPLPSGPTAPTPAAIQLEKPTSVPGIDVSHDQRVVDWGQVVASGKKWAYAKATEGLAYRDPLFVRNWAGMRAAGIFRGAYHFLHPDQDAQAQAEAFLAELSRANGGTTLGEGCLPPMLDVEKANGCTQEQIAEGVQTWLALVAKATGFEVGELVLYCGWGFWDAAVAPAMPVAPCRLWAAEYGVTSPRLPIGFKGWTFWQTSGSGTCSGVSTPVDLDVFNGEIEDLTAMAKQGG